MRCAFLVQCHKNPGQVNRMIHALEDPDFDFYIHPDAKSDIAESISKKPNVFIIPKPERVDVEWSRISQVDATLRLINTACQHADYDYYCLLSGQDYPIQSTKAIKQMLSENSPANYIDLCETFEVNGVFSNFDKRNSIFFPHWMIGRSLFQRIVRNVYIKMTGGYFRTFPCFARKNRYHFYFGSSWWCLSGQTISWMLEYLQSDQEFYHYYKNCICPDESFFQTLFMMSPEHGNRAEFLHYICWQNESSPKFLTIDDYDAIASSGKQFARKFDLDVDSTVLDKIDTLLRRE